jgi:hypothetical protein
MKNYVQLWLCALNDGGNPPSLLGYAFTPSFEEAVTFMNDNGFNAGPTQYYFPLSKLLVAALISQYPWPVQADATLSPNPTQYSRVKGDVLDWNIQNPLWQFDDQDKWQVQAVSTATKVLAENKKAKQDLSGAPTLIENFINLMNQLIATYKRKKDARTVGILQFMLEEFLNGTKSITDLLQELENLFIV